MATEEPKRLRRMFHEGIEVTVLQKGKIKSVIRTHFGFVLTVPTKQLKEIPDSSGRYIEVVKSQDES